MSQENKTKLRTLRTRRDFLDLKLKGKKVRPAPWLVVSVRNRPGEGPRFGWILPKSVGTAVVRNRLRRWIRVFLQERLAQGEGCDADICFVFLRAPEGFFRKLAHDEVDRVLEKAWKQIC